MNAEVPSRRIRPCRTLPARLGSHAFFLCSWNSTAAASLQIGRLCLRGGAGEPGVRVKTPFCLGSLKEDLLLFLRQAGHNPGCLVPSALGLVNVSHSRRARL